MTYAEHGGTTLRRLVTQYEIITQLQRSTRLDATDLQKLPRPASFVPRPVTAAGSHRAGTPIEVTGTVPASLALQEVLETRTSERFFTGRTVDAAVVAHVLEAARKHDEAQWPQEHQAGVALELIVAACNVEGLDSGLYRLGDGHFELLCPLHEPLDDLVLQLEFASSAFIIVAVLPLADELERWADHGERVANLRAGGAIAAGLITAQGLGLAASPFAGFLAAPFRALVSADGYRHAPLFAGAFGHR